MYSRRYALGVVLIAFALSFGFSVYYKIQPAADAQGYENIGINLARGLGYIEKAENANDIAKDDAIVRVGPGYEFFLASIFSVFGHSLFAVWMIQALLRAATAWLLYRFSLFLFSDETMALVAALVFACMPDLIVVGGMLLMETVLLFLLVAAAYVSSMSFTDTRLRYVAGAGFLWSLAALVRPTALVPLAFYVLFLAYQKRRAHAVVAIIFSIVFLGAWSLRNSLLYHEPLFTTTAGSYGLWVGNYMEATGGWYKTPEIQEIRNTYHSVPLQKIANERYKTFIVEHPFRFIELQFRKTIKYFTLLRPTGFWFYLNDKPLQRLVTLGASWFFTALFFVAGSVGFWKIAQRKKIAEWFLCAVMLAQPLTVIPTYVETRYRYPLYPFLALCVGYIIVAFVRSRGEERIQLARSFAVSGMLFVGITVIDAFYAFATLKSRLIQIWKSF